MIRADWTRPNEKINIFLEKYDRFGIPFNAFFSKNFPNGILLSELLSEKELVEAINKIIMNNIIPQIEVPIIEKGITSKVFSF